MNKPIKSIGFIGTGYIAEWHMRALKSIKSLHLAAICDFDLNRAQAFSDKYGKPKCYSSWEQMINEEKLDCVHVLLPPPLHYQAVKFALENKVNVFVEKPFTLNVEEAEELSLLAHKQDLQLGVNHNFLFYPIYEELKELICSKQLGPINQITIKWNKEYSLLRKGPFDTWLFKDPSNLLLEVGPHSIAHLLDLYNTPQSFHVQVSDPIVPEKGVAAMYQHWQIIGTQKNTSFSLNFHFGPCFEEHSVQVDGQAGCAVADFEGNRLIIKKHTPYSIDIDRYLRAKYEARNLKNQAWTNFKNYIFQNCGFNTPGNAFGYSIRRSIETFYNGIAANHLDKRLSPEFGAEVVKWCRNFGKQIQISSSINYSQMPVSASVRKTKDADIVVIGGAGFIGKELVRQLVKEGKQVKVLCRNPNALPASWKVDSSIIIQKFDLQNVRSFDDAIGSAKTVYHLATSGSRTWDESLKVDVNNLVELAKACLQRKVQRLIYTSSIASYYAGSSTQVIDEKTPFPDSIDKWQPYSRSKALAEKELIKLYRDAGLPLVIFRPGIVLGEESSPFHWGVGMWRYESICKMWGDGNNPLPFVLVEDVAKALIKGSIVPNIEGQSFNLIGDIRLTAREYVKELSRAAEMEIEARPTPICRFYLIDLFKWMAKCILLYPNRHMPNYYNLESGSQKSSYNNAWAKKVLQWQPETDRIEWIRKGIEDPVTRWLK